MEDMQIFKKRSKSDAENYGKILCLTVERTDLENLEKKHR
jgi:hypothetical protein